MTIMPRASSWLKVVPCSSLLYQEGCIYTNPKDKYEQFIEQFYQRNRSTGRTKSQIISEGQVATSVCFQEVFKGVGRYNTEPSQKLATFI